MTTISDAYIGSTPISGIYRGSVPLWVREPAEAATPDEVQAYDFTLHTAGDPLPSGMTAISGTWTIADDGGTTSLQHTGSPIPSLLMWNDVLAENMEIVTLSRHTNTSGSWLRNGVGANLTSTPSGWLVYRMGTTDVRLYNESNSHNETKSGVNAAIAADTLVYMRLRSFAEDGAFKFKIWDASTSEPTEWSLDGTFAVGTPPGTIGSPGVGSRRDVGNLYVQWIGVSTVPEAPAPLSGEITPVNAPGGGVYDPTLLYVTDWSDVALGEEPAGWSQHWYADVDGRWRASDKKAPPEGIPSDYVLECDFRIDGSGNNNKLFAPDGVGDLTDVEILHLVNYTAGATNRVAGGVALRAALPTVDGLAFTWRAYDRTDRKILTAGTSDTSTLSTSPWAASGEWSYHRTRIVGQNWSTKAWAFGTEEPAAWQHTGTLDPEVHTSGRVGLYGFSVWNTDADLSWFSAWFGVKDLVAAGTDPIVVPA